MAKHSKKNNTDIKVYDVAHDSTSTQKARHMEKFSSKTTLNLCMKVKTMTVELFFLLLAIILVVVMFVEYFGIYRPYLAVEEAEAALADERAALADIENKLSDYEDVRQQYREYNYENYDRTIASRPDVFSLLEKVVFPEGKITSMDLRGNRLTMTIIEVPNANLSRLNKNLFAEDIVAAVSYTRSGYDNNGEVPTLNFVITLKNPDDQGGN